MLSFASNQRNAKLNGKSSQPPQLDKSSCQAAKADEGLGNEEPVARGGGCRPDRRFGEQLCDIHSVPSTQTGFPGVRGRGQLFAGTRDLDEGLHRPGARHRRGLPAARPGTGQTHWFVWTTGRSLDKQLKRREQVSAFRGGRPSRRGRAGPRAPWRPVRARGCERALADCSPDTRRSRPRPSVSSAAERTSSAPGHGQHSLRSLRKEFGARFCASGIRKAFFNKAGRA